MYTYADAVWVDQPPIEGHKNMLHVGIEGTVIILDVQHWTYAHIP